MSTEARWDMWLELIVNNNKGYAGSNCSWALASIVNHLGFTHFAAIHCLFQVSRDILLYRAQAVSHSWSFSYNSLTSKIIDR